MRYNELNTIKESQTIALSSNDRNKVAKLVKSTKDRADRKELLRRLVWIGYPVK